MADETDKDTMQTVTASGRPVKERIQNIAAARAVYETLKDDSSEALRRARLKGLIDGNAPYNQQRLQELGMGNRINVNFLEARAILDLKAAAHYELFFEVPTLIEVRLAPGFGEPDVSSQYGAVISEEFSRTLFEWSGFLVNMDIVRREADAYGLGVMLWRDEWDWRPRAFRRASFLVHPMAGLDIEELPVFGVRDSMTVGELYEAAIKNEKVAVAAGWNPGAVKRALVRIYRKEFQQNTSDPFQLSDWESVQQRIRNNDWQTQSAEFQDVMVVHLCVRESDTGETSHYIFTEDSDPGRDEFMFKRSRRYANMRQALWWLPYNNGDQYVRSVRGLASMIEPHCDLSNRFLCQTFDAGFMAGSLLIQPNSPMDLSKLLLVRMGPLTVLPPGVSAIQTSFTPNLMQMVQLRELSSLVMRNNTGVFRQHPETFTENQPNKTARQVVEEVAKEARVEKANVAYDYAHIERLYKEIFRRMTRVDYVMHSAELPGKKTALDFVARCLMRGVPLNLLTATGAWDVRITRAIGMGSWGVKMDITNQLLSARPLLDEAGQVQATRDWLAVRVGYQNVDKYKPLRNRDTVPTNEISIATLENNDLMEGSAVAVGIDQTHMLHLQTHNKLVIQLMQVWQKTRGEGVDLGRFIRALSVIVPHLEQTTQAMSADPMRDAAVKQEMQLVKAAAAVLRQAQMLYAKQMKTQMQEQQVQQQLVAEALQSRQDQEIQLKAQELAGKLRLEQEKQDSLNKMRADKTAEQLSIRRQQAEQDMALRAERQKRELDMQAVRTEADIAMARQKEAET